MFGKKFFSTVALSGATVSLVGNVGSFAEEIVKVDGNKKIIESSESREYVLYILDYGLEECQDLLKRGKITKDEMVKSKKKIEKIRKDFLNDKYVNLDGLSSLDLESILKESDYFHTAEKGHPFYCAFVLGKYKGKKMFGIVGKDERTGKCFEQHTWIA